MCYHQVSECTHICVCVCVCSSSVVWDEEICWQLVFQNSINSIMHSPYVLINTGGFYFYIKKHALNGYLQIPYWQTRRAGITHSVFTCDLTSVRNSSSFFFANNMLVAASTKYKHSYKSRYKWFSVLVQNPALRTTLTDFQQKA